MGDVQFVVLVILSWLGLQMSYGARWKEKEDNLGGGERERDGGTSSIKS